MTGFQILSLVLSLVGLPSLFSIACYFYNITNTKIKNNNNITESVQLGVQALLRAQMINDYNKWVELGYAPIYAKENFENCWKQYHSLGANGVMDDIHKKFLDLPTSPNHQI